MKLTMIVLVLVLIGAAALLVMPTLRWLGFLIESCQRRTRQCRGGAISIAAPPRDHPSRNQRDGDGDATAGAESL